MQGERRWWEQITELLTCIDGPALPVATRFHDDLAALRQHVPLVSALRTAGLKARHWAAISKAAGVSVRAGDEALSLASAIKMRLPKYVAKIAKVAARAAHELETERTFEQKRVRVACTFHRYHNVRTWGKIQKAEHKSIIHNAATR